MWDFILKIKTQMEEHPDATGFIIGGVAVCALGYKYGNHIIDFLTSDDFQQAPEGLEYGEPGSDIPSIPLINERGGWSDLELSWLQSGLGGKEDCLRKSDPIPFSFVSSEERQKVEEFMSLSTQRYSKLNLDSNNWLINEVKTYCWDVVLNYSTENDIGTTLTFIAVTGGVLLFCLKQRTDKWENENFGPDINKDCEIITRKKENSLITLNTNLTGKDLKALWKYITVSHDFTQKKLGTVGADVVHPDYDKMHDHIVFTMDRSKYMTRDVLRTIALLKKNVRKVEREAEEMPFEKFCSLRKSITNNERPDLFVSKKASIDLTNTRYNKKSWELEQSVLLSEHLKKSIEIYENKIHANYKELTAHFNGRDEIKNNEIYKQKLIDTIFLQELLSKYMQENDSLKIKMKTQYANVTAMENYFDVLLQNVVQQENIKRRALIEQKTSDDRLYHEIMQLSDDLNKSIEGSSLEQSYNDTKSFISDLANADGYVSDDETNDCTLKLDRLFDKLTNLKTALTKLVNKKYDNIDEICQQKTQLNLLKIKTENAVKVLDGFNEEWKALDKVIPGYQHFLPDQDLKKPNARRETKQYQLLPEQSFEEQNNNNQILAKQSFEEQKNNNQIPAKQSFEEQKNNNQIPAKQSFENQPKKSSYGGFQLSQGGVFRRH
jgi:hypothetical protein